MLDITTMKELSILYVSLLLFSPRTSYPWTIACGHCSLIIFYSLCPHWIALSFGIPLLAVVSWLRALRLHPSGFLGAWWIHRKPVIHTSVIMQPRWRSDLKKGCTAAEAACSNQNASDHSLLSSSSFSRTLYLSYFCYYFFCSLPLTLFPFVAFSLCLSVSTSVFALNTLRFQSWWVTRELPCCSQIPPSHP